MSVLPSIQIAPRLAYFNLDWIAIGRFCTIINPVGASYINTDLLAKAKFHPEKMIRGLNRRISACGPVWEDEDGWHISFATAGLNDEFPWQTVEKLVKAVEMLGVAARLEWDQCHVRCFDIGFRGHRKCYESGWNLPHELLQRIEKVGESITITIYRADEEDE